MTRSKTALRRTKSLLPAASSSRFPSSLHISSPPHLNPSINQEICCVCVCVCEREREREGPWLPPCRTLVSSTPPRCSRLASSSSSSSSASPPCQRFMLNLHPLPRLHQQAMEQGSISELRIP